MTSRNDWEAISTVVREFNDSRITWQRLHSPKNLAMAVASEAGELLALYRWAETIEGTESPELEHVSGEIADIAIFLAALCHSLGVELVDVVYAKLKQNEQRF